MIKKLLIFIICINAWIQPVYAKAFFKLLSFNTMCEFCHKNDEDKFDNRKKKIKEIIRKSNADIIALQEVTRKSHLNYFLDSNQYYIFFYENWLFSYPDAVLALKKERFHIKKNGHYWLGPNSNSLNFGWKMAMPRLFVYADVMDKWSGREFKVMSTHFDNRLENLKGSADLISKIAKDTPLLFLGDTNSTYEMESYQILTQNMKDLAIDFKGEREYCYLKKGKFFPECRVDHILSNIKNIKSINYKVMLDKVNERFPSDHRPIYLEITL